MSPILLITFGVFGTVLATGIVWFPLILPGWLVTLSILMIALNPKTLLEVASKRSLRTISLFLVLLTVSALTIFWSIDHEASIERLLQVFGLLVVYLCVKIGFGKLSQQNIFISSGLLYLCVGIATLLVLAEATSDSALRHLYSALDPIEAYAILNKPVTILVCLVFSAAYALFLGIRRYRVPAIRLVLVGAFFLGVGVALQYIPSNAAAMAFGWGVVSFCVSFLFVRSVAYFPAVVFGCCAILGPSLVNLGLTEWLLVAFGDGISPSLIHRLAIWDFTSASISERYFWGYGLDAARSLPGASQDAAQWLMARYPSLEGAQVLRSITGYDIHPLHPHNIPLQVRLELGVLGSLLGILILWRIGSKAAVTPHIGHRMVRVATLNATFFALFISFGLWQTWLLALLAFIFLADQILCRTRESDRIVQEQEGQAAKKVLILTLNEVTAPAGSSVHVKKLATALSEKGYEVQLFARGDKGDDDTEVKFSTLGRWTADSVPKKLHAASVMWATFIWNTIALRHQVFTMIYIRGSSATLPCAIWAKLFLYGPLVTEQEGWFQDDSKILGFPNWIGAWHALLQKADADTSDLVRVTTMRLKRVFVEQGSTWDKICVIGNGTDTRQFYPGDRANARRKFGISEDHQVIGFIGDLSPWQGVERLIHAIPTLEKQIPNLQILIGGDGVMLDGLKDQASTLGVADRVKFLGRLEHDQVNDLIACCDVMTTPFVEERGNRIGSSPSVIPDISSAGRPIVSSAIDGITELVDAGFVHVCDTKDAQLYADTLAALLQDQNKQSEMGRRGREFAESKFDWQKIADRLLQEIAITLAPQNSAADRSTIVHLIPSLEVGGAERMLANFARNDPKNDTQHIVISALGGGVFAKSISNSGWPVFALMDKRPSTKSVMSMFRILPSFFKLRHLLARIQPDAINAWMYHGGLLSVLNSSLGQRHRIILNIRCSVMDLSRYALPLKLSFYVSKILSRFATKVIYNSHSGLKEHLDAGFSDQNSLVIVNGVDTQAFRPDVMARRAMREMLSIPEQSVVVCTVARYDPMKGYDLLDEAIDHIGPDVHFIVVGRGTKGRLRDRPNVHMLGERSDIPTILSAGDVFCLPSRFGEGFPNALLEAMSIGLLPVTFDTGDCAFIVGDSGIVMGEKTSSALMEGLKLAQERLEVNRALPENPVRKSIIDRFSVEQAASNYFSEIEEVASEGRS